ncbi:hypothetical protein M2360_001776 [Rhizobium sp. SG_E_25_P2]|uniref:hypothetical protein n=1 Tax=Rhizobium sp. SG_E_25_P2 TaxID=2879942 RepID=UPI0024752A37|nr:hypothetical protein [Rhizobium sp. SG_E_25_P2]MDH6266380.1 hypothetical protein [Rhizobium sp. SG_E_25_P2]
MGTPRSRVTGLSPYNVHGSVLDRASYRNVVDKRDRFQNDAVNPNSDSAVEFLERLEVLHEIAGFMAARPGVTRPGLPARYTYNRADPATVLSLVYFQITRGDLTPGAGPQPVSQILEDMNGIQEDGMLPDERRVIALLEDYLEEKLPRRVEEETLRFNRSLQHTERFRLADGFHSSARYNSTSKKAAASTFLKRQTVWRGQLSFNACQALAIFEADLARLTSIDLSRLETKFHVSRLPSHDHLTMVGSRTSRIAISMAASIPRKQSSPISQLDPVLAALVARKYHAYLTAQKLAISTRGRYPPKDLIFHHYFSLV